VLGGAASPEHRYTGGLHFFFFAVVEVVVVPAGVVVVVVLVVLVVGATYLPTTIVTVIPFLACVEAAGF
jgi:hypothetical protein